MPARETRPGATDLLLFRADGLPRARSTRRGLARAGAHAPGAEARPGAVRGRLGRVRRADGDNYPFHHPRYAGQMLKPPHPVAIAAYTAALHVNANNHALDGGPATSAHGGRGDARGWREMFGFPGDALGHLTSSGTIANLEALWVARELHPGKAIVVRRQRALHALAHVRRAGRRAFEAPRTSPAGSTSTRSRSCAAPATSGRSSSPRARPALGTVDDVARAVAFRERYGVRVHVDAAYGGFFTLLADSGLIDGVLPARSPAPTASSSTRTSTACSPTGAARSCSATRASAGCTSTTRPTRTSPPASCTWARSRSSARARGAAAAALWLTLRSLDLAPILAAGVRAAQAWAALIRGLGRAHACHASPSSTSSPTSRRAARASEIDAASAARARRRHERRRTRSSCRRCGSTRRRSPPRTRTSRWTPTACASCAAC